MKTKLFILISSFLLITLQSTAQTGKVQGKILGTDNQPIEFAVVTVLNTTVSGNTINNGSYLISNVPIGMQTLVIYKAGFVQDSIKIEIIKNQTTVAPDRILNEKSANLSEVTISAKREEKYVETDPSTSLRINT